MTKKEVKVTKLEELDELRSKYFDKFGTIFTVWNMLPDDAITAIKKCLEEGKQFKCSMQEGVET